MTDTEICRIYSQGTPLRRLSKLLSISEAKLRKILVRNGVAIRSRGGQREYTLNEKAFDHITEESAYWLGFLLTDGSVTKKGMMPHYVNLGLDSSDKEHVISFGKFLQSNQPIKEYDNDGYKAGNGKKRSLLSVSSRKLASKLEEYNIVPNKTAVTAAPGSLKSNPHFWRGTIDGDGWVCTHNGKMPMIGLCGTKQLVSQFRDFVLIVTETSARIHPSKKSDINWKYQIAGKPAQVMIEHLYAGAPIALPRKAKAAFYWISNPYDPSLKRDVKGKFTPKENNG